MRIGIFLTGGLASDIRKEGLGRYTARLLKGFLESGHGITVACPKWLVKPLGVLLEDNGIDIGAVQLITVPHPVAIALRMWLKGRKTKIKRPGGRFKRLMGGVAFEVVSMVLSATNVLFFLLLAVLMGVLGLMVLPLLALYWVVTHFNRFVFFVKKVIHKIFKKTPPEAAADDDGPTRTRDKITAMRIAYMGKVYSRVVTKNLSRLVDKINHLHCVDIWYSPFVPCPAFNDIKGVRVMNVPDLVTAAFPQGFADHYIKAHTENVRTAIRNERFLITYSEYVRDNTVIKGFNKDKDHVLVINHAVNDLSKHVDIYANTRHMGFPKEINYNFARERIGGIKYYAELPGNNNVAAYIRNLNLKDVRYIFYASQIRPNKNIFALLMAYEYVLRRQYGQIKLILTGNYSLHQDLYLYILNKRLQYDVLSFSNVSEDMLACLYASAELVVNPTLYEGAFPFTFGEGMSVGTPSVMSRIPQTEEFLDRFGDCSDFLFDPYDWRDMAEKIMYGLAHREALYDRQLKMYEVMAKRTWKEVSEEYIAAFQMVKENA